MAKDKSGQWPHVGNITTSISAHHHNLTGDLQRLQNYIKTREETSSGAPGMPAARLKPLLSSFDSFLEKFSRESGVQAWETHLNEITVAQKLQSQQIADLIKAVQTATAPPTAPDSVRGNRLQGNTSGGYPGGSYASIAARAAEPSPAVKTVRSWTSATGTTHYEYITETHVREITIKLHDSLRDDGKAIKSWLQGSLAGNSRALINHINQAIHQGATEPPGAPASGPSGPDVEMADSNIAPTEELRPFHGIQVNSATFLKSGDIQVHTAFVAQASLLLEHADQWVKYVGHKAKVVIPTYGVVIHAIPTNSFYPERPKEMATQLQTLNASMLQGATITHSGWLTSHGATKQMSSIVVEFSQPEPANRLIVSGCLWSNESHLVERYDKSCRIKQCLRCQKYGHITTQCASAHDICGFCSQSHDTRKCPVRSSPAPPKDP
ncbi:hypothetical protein PG989_000749 [Apiospora arundinis]